MLKTNTIRSKQSAALSTKTQLSLYLPMFYYYLTEYLASKESLADPLLPKLKALELRVKELLQKWHPKIDASSISQNRAKLGRHLLKWQVDLLESEQAWVSWFTGITNEFLSQSKFGFVGYYMKAGV